MQEFLISVDLAGVMEAANRQIDEVVFPLIHETVQKTAARVHLEWVEAVLRSNLWSGERDAYANTIDLKEVGPFAYVVWSDYKYAEDIETGRPAYDMKKMLQTSSKTRTSKAGKKYLIIPFRHNSPGNTALGDAMPKAIYKEAKALTSSKVTMNSGTRVSASGATVPKHTYLWGGRLPSGLAPKLQTHHKSDPYAGMVRFDTTTPGGRRYSSYLTFRVMSESSTGWILKPKEGLHIVQGVVDKIRPEFEKAIAGAFAATTA